MLENKIDESEIINQVIKENDANEAPPPEEAADAPLQQTSQQPDLEAAQSQAPPPNESNNDTTLNPLNDIESHMDTDTSKGKQRRYWTPKEEERFFEIWGRENWRLTRHGKNTVFFAQWSEELRERHSMDVKPEEIQCKVNQTRAKFRSVKKLIEGGSNTQKWKKFDLVEKILKNQFRSKDDEPVPLDALENNRDMSPTELLNCETRPPSANGGDVTPNSEQNINLSQAAAADPQLTDEVNMSNISLSDTNLTSNVFCNSSHSSTSFSTELFGGDHLDIKKEIDNDLLQDGFDAEFISTVPTSDAPIKCELFNVDAINGMQIPAVLQDQQQQLAIPQLPPMEQQQDTMSMMNQQNQQNLLENTNNIIDNEQQKNHAIMISNTTIINSNTIPPPPPPPQQQNTMVVANNCDPPLVTATVNTTANATSNTTANATANATANTTVNTTIQQNHALVPNNHVAPGTMQPPKSTMPIVPTPSPRKRNAPAKQHHPISQDSLESLYLDEVKKKNVILVEQGEINRKRLKLEEKKVKLMEDFFPKYLTLQQEILQKLDRVTSTASEATINVKMDE